MYITKLRLYNFRNIEEAQLELVPGTNFLLGRNGQGKTNIVEAINVLSVAKSFRSSKVRDLVNWSHSEASVFANLTVANGELELGLSIQNSRRTAYINGDKLNALPEFVGKLCCVCFSPSDLALVKGAPQIRRRFIDRHLVDAKPHLFSSILSYQRALKNKNALLKQESSTQDEVYSWNLILAETAEVIIKERIELLERLETHVNQIHSTYSSNDGVLELALESSFKHEKTELTKANILEYLNSAYQKETIVGSSLLGPHRDDMSIRLNGRDARAFSSQGQARSIVLSLKLAIIEILEEQRQDSPIILLDDIDSELDNKRSTALFDIIFSQNQQTIITGTESRFHERSKEKNCSIFYIKNGTILHDSEQLSNSAI